MQEMQSLVAYVQEMVLYHTKHKPEIAVYPTSVTRSLVEELTGESFEFDEILPVFEDYIPDAKSDGVSAGQGSHSHLHQNTPVPPPYHPCTTSTCTRTETG